MPEELIALHDSYNCEHVKLCWDFGHGNTAVPERHPEAIRMLGSRLKCTHIDDNHGGKDEHLLPFLGTVPWEKVMPVLKEIGYTGTLNLEVGFNKYMPDDLKDTASVMTYQILRKLQALAEG
jgi:sugar phosphate isomerase/epimerase